jgi:hypothetical protein
MRRFIACTILISVFLLVPVHDDARATLLKGMSLDSLCRDSGVIVRGKVVARVAAWKGGRIYTRVTLRVTSSLRGKHRAGQSVSFWRLGGRVGQYVQLVRGAPTFGAGDRVLVFLNQRGGRLFVTGMAQGRFSIHAANPANPANPANSSNTTHPANPNHSATVTQSFAGARILGPKRALRQPTTLARFVQRIHDALRRQKAGTP